MRLGKFLSKTAIMSVLAAACLGSTAMAADVIGTGTVEGDSLRVRSEASTTASIVTYLTDKTQVEVYEDLGDWYKVGWGDHTGYVSADYLVYTPAAASTSSAAPAPTAVQIAGEPGVITGAGVNFRVSPSTDAQAITQLARHTDITVVEPRDDGWCQIGFGGQTGYVKSDYVSVNGIPLVDPKGIITGDCVNLRATPSTDGAIVTKLSYGETVDLVSLDDGWYSISYNGAPGFVSADYLRVDDGTNPVSAIGASVVESAMKYLGTPYAYGGASGKGFDCSGFTMYIYSLHGYSLPHSATSQWNSSGVYVEKSDLQPGDLVLFNDPARNAGKACSHVGIYIGDNQFIHSSSSRSGGVIISSLGENYYSSYYKGAKRVG